MYTHAQEVEKRYQHKCSEYDALEEKFQAAERKLNEQRFTNVSI